MFSRALLSTALILFFSGCATQTGPRVEGAARSQFSTSSFATPQPFVLPTRLYTVTPKLVQQLQERTPDPEADAALKGAVARYQYRIGPADVIGLSVWGVDKTPVTTAAPKPGAVAASKPAPMVAGPSPTPAASPAPAKPAAAQAGSPRPDIFDSVKPVPGLQFLKLIVQQDGTVSLPYLGQLKVAGLTQQEVQRLFGERIVRFVPLPVVDLRILEYRAHMVTVTGEVSKPGQIALDDKPLTLLELVGRVGPLKPDADARRLTLTRSGKAYPIALHRLMKGEPGYNVPLLSGDLVHFPTNTDSRVFLLGEINRKGRTVLPIGADGLTLGEALASLGGVNALTADPRGVFVMRSSRDEPGVIQVFQLDIENAAAYVMADRFPLRPRDYVFVSAEPISAARRVLNRILPGVGEEVLAK